ncbi:hypothetical protein Hrd1104_10220 [Halorhabdus sp. CBA1104]|uniref:helix-turn-helix transcriptional regulator n=1 Tax=unclassified Halorhabdus TaxID=2621901 RepID=UPI0012B33673|nr:MULTISPECIES: helix-turn-helix domain-containing protein [unclassified Halorhabdus]QGN08249.1 hypothetical protein Hrd1104_10220 [Halorhabdus sp. CBA1104]
MSRRVAAVGFVLVVAALVGAPIAAANGLPLAFSSGDQLDEAAPSSPSPAVAAPDRGATLLAVGAEDFDQTLFRIEVSQTTAARWTFQYARVFGDNESERDNFEAFAANFRTNQTDLYAGFVDQATALAATGANVTGRSMNATNFSRDAYVTPLGNRGVVEMSFTWTNFGTRQGEDILVSDVFQGGLHIQSDQRLRFVAGPELAFERATPSPTNSSGLTIPQSDSITWVGEQTFTDQHPSVVFQPSSALLTPTTTTRQAGGTEPGGTGSTPTATPALTTTGQSPTTAAGATGPDFGPLVVLAALGLIALGIGVAAWLNGVFDPDEAGASGTTTDDTDRPADTVADSPTPAEPSVDEAELLSDRDRVVNLLEEHGGRMRQTAIVDATEWSKSKVSMLLSEMEDDDEITKLRVGRENIISLPGNEPAAARSPFDDIDDSEQ